MSLIDGLLLTLLNTIACLALPKLLSVIVSLKNKSSVRSPSATTSQDDRSEVPSFS